MRPDKLSATRRSVVTPCQLQLGATQVPNGSTLRSQTQAHVHTYTCPHRLPPCLYSPPTCSAHMTARPCRPRCPPVLRAPILRLPSGTCSPAPRDLQHPHLHPSQAHKCTQNNTRIPASFPRSTSAPLPHAPREPAWRPMYGARTAPPILPARSSLPILPSSTLRRPALSACRKLNPGRVPDCDPPVGLSPSTHL
jgi:hypothetical protein